MLKLFSVSEIKIFSEGKFLVDSFTMVRDQEIRMKLKVLQKVDPYIVSIIVSTTNAAYYTFNVAKVEWKKEPFEGSLYLYRRQAEPLYGFQIMNRLNPEIMVEVLDKDFKLNLNTPYLQYKKTNGQINCIGFNLKEECRDVHK